MDNSKNAEVASALLLNSHPSPQSDEPEFEDLFDPAFNENSNSDFSELQREEPRQQGSFYENIEAYSDDRFKFGMRMKRETVEFLISKYSQYLLTLQTSSAERPKICCRNSIYMYIWYISNYITLPQLGNLFQVTKSLAWKTVSLVTDWLISISHEFIKWPQGSEVEEMQKLFEQKKKITGVIGAIGCIHIGIQAPNVDKENYLDREQNFSLVLQAVVDANKKFIDVYCGEPGSLHDSRVLRRSDLYRRVYTNAEHLFPNSTYLLGDSSYSPTNWLVPPYYDYDNLTDTQKRFNELHSSTRMVVADAFGLFKSRFRRLSKFTEEINLCAVTNLIASACVLHNICITMEDIYEESGSQLPYDVAVESDIDGFIPEEPSNRRQTIFNYLQEQNII